MFKQLTATALFVVVALATTLTAVANNAVILVRVEKDAYSFPIQPAATPRVSESYHYYDIRGNDEKELRRQMKQNGTKWNDGKTYDALTSWKWKWDYAFDSSGQGCGLASFKPSLQITFRYPRWTPERNAPGELVRKWEAYMKNLIEHENGHRDMAVEATLDFSRVVAELAPAAACEDLERQISAISRERMAKLNADSAEYDHRTSHGRTQGAVFP